MNGALGSNALGATPIAGEEIPQWESSADPRDATLSATMDGLGLLFGMVHYEWFETEGQFVKINDHVPTFVVDDAAPTAIVFDVLTTKQVE